MKVFGGILVFIGAIVAWVFLSHMNNVPKFEENVIAKASQVDNQYKRRSDLLPNLVETVKGYAKHEKETFLEVVNARKQSSNITLSADTLKDPAALAAFQKAQQGISGVFNKLFALSERYPDLKANKNFLELQASVEGTENRIAVARMDLIKSIKQYNIELKTIPGKWIAALLYPEAEVMTNFKATEQERQNVKIKF